MAAYNLCRNGSSCSYNLRGRCRFLHTFPPRHQYIENVARNQKPHNLEHYQETYYTYELEKRTSQAYKSENYQTYNIRQHEEPCKSIRKSSQSSRHPYKESSLKMSYEYNCSRVTRSSPPAAPPPAVSSHRSSPPDPPTYVPSSRRTLLGPPPRGSFRRSNHYSSPSYRNSNQGHKPAPSYKSSCLAQVEIPYHRRRQPDHLPKKIPSYRPLDNPQYRNGRRAPPLDISPNRNGRQTAPHGLPPRRNFHQAPPARIPPNIQSQTSAPRPPVCRNGPSCTYKSRGACRFSHPPPCRNGTSCGFLRIRTCRFYHGRDEKVEESAISSDKDSQSGSSGSGSSSGALTEGEFSDTEEESLDNWVNNYLRNRTFDVEDRFDFNESENPSSPVHSDLKCCVVKETTSKEENVLKLMEGLPEELKLAVLRRMEQEDLFRLDLPQRVLRLALQVPKNHEISSWLGKELVLQDQGLIFVPEGNRLFISNFDDQDSILLDMDVITQTPLQVSDLTPGLTPGVYKVRLLSHGVDLVKVGSPFLSSQCGPQACYHHLPDTQWPCSTLSRGWRLDREDRSDLAVYGWLVASVKNSWRLPRDNGDLRGPALVICVRPEFWTKPWLNKPVRVYSRDSVGGRLEMKVLLDLDGEVVAYVIHGTNFWAFDPLEVWEREEGEREDTPCSEVTGNEFYVVRYGAQNDDKNVGFIITGNKSEYVTPDKEHTKHVSNSEDAENFPDKEHYM